MLNIENTVLLQKWLKTDCSISHFKLEALANDASFRRYYRVHVHKQSYVAMIAPLDKENISTFVAIAKNFANQGVHIPEILACNLEQGFLLLSDLGNGLFFNLLNNKTVNDLYTRALTVIPQIQVCKPILKDNQPLGLFDEAFIRFELNLFVDWFLKRYLQFTITTKLSTLFEKIFQLLITSALEQPRVCVHRDYHSRNLLLVDNEKVGVLDFQDAIYGPITYDAVSLLRDAYIAWPEEQVEKWALTFHEMLNPKHSVSREKFLRWFDLIGIQRHLKILGIFARLQYRDQKPHYLAHTDRLLHYLQRVCEKHTEFSELKQLLQSNVRAKLKEQETEKK